MRDALDSLCQHEDTPEAVRQAIKFQPVIGTHTRKLVACLLTALLCEKVPGFHGDPGDWVKAGEGLMQSLLDGAYTDKLIPYSKVNAGMRATRETFSPEGLLLLWGATRKGLEAKRTRAALQRYEQHNKAA